MLRSGEDYLAGLRDGRTVYLGNEKVEDVSAHPAFRNAARTIASVYDLKRREDGPHPLSFREGDEDFSAYYKMARTREDLEFRTHAHRELAAFHCGLMGRSLDYVSSFVTGMATRPALFGAYAGNITSYYDFMRREDIYLAHAVVPPQTSRDPLFYERPNVAMPSCRVVEERDDGVVVRGMKMLATGAILADEVWVGNIIPLAPEHKSEAITFAMPCNTPGLSMWSRKSYEGAVEREWDAPLAARFDETDCVLIFEDVLVPWERVFVHNDPALARGIYINTPAHVYGNHQSNVRVQAKLQFVIGLASRLVEANNLGEIAAVRETMGRLAGQEAVLGGMIAGQIQSAEDWADGYVGYNRRMMYAAMNWCVENYAKFIEQLRTLLGGGAFNLPASISVLDDENLAALFTNYWTTPQIGAVDRLKLIRLVWDMVGSEFAGRQLQYEQFFAGAAMILAGHNHREAPWDLYKATVDRFLDA
jgi:4-hydroxyphenylacetate 3-monooxygenase